MPQRRCCCMTIYSASNQFLTIYRQIVSNISDSVQGRLEIAFEITDKMAP